VENAQNSMIAAKTFGSENQPKKRMNLPKSNPSQQQSITTAQA
jgi:hypothetical protein